MSVGFWHYFMSLYACIFLSVAAELEQLLVKQSSLEIYFEWLDSLIERKVCEVRSDVCSL